jgi:hypothetical protein
MEKGRRTCTNIRLGKVDRGTEESMSKIKDQEQDAFGISDRYEGCRGLQQSKTLRVGVSLSKCRAISA